MKALFLSLSNQLLSFLSLKNTTSPPMIFLATVLFLTLFSFLKSLNASFTLELILISYLFLQFAVFNLPTASSTPLKPLYFAFKMTFSSLLINRKSLPLFSLTSLLHLTLLTITYFSLGFTPLMVFPVPPFHYFLLICPTALSLCPSKIILLTPSHSILASRRALSLAHFFFPSIPALSLIFLLIRLSPSTSMLMTLSSIYLSPALIRPPTLPLFLPPLMLSIRGSP